MTDRPLENIRLWYEEIAAFTGGARGTVRGLRWVTNPYDEWYGGTFGIAAGQEAQRFDELVRAAAAGAASGSMAEKLLITEPGELRLSPRERAVLQENGFSEDMAQTGMVIDLAGFQTGNGTAPAESALSDAVSAGARMVRAASEEEFADWAQMVEEAFQAAEHRELIRCFVRDSRFRIYSCYVDGKAAAGALAYYCGEEAGIYLVGTVPEFRRRGLAEVVMRTLLSDAQKAGMRLGVLQASKMGRPVYRRIGFRETGRISHWIFSGNGINGDMDLGGEEARR